MVKPDEAKDFDGYQAVCLLNVAEPAKLQGPLRAYVEAGGKLLIAPGTDNRGYEAFDLMPAKLFQQRAWPPDHPTRPGGLSWKIDDDDELKKSKLTEPFVGWKSRGNVDVVRNPRKAWRHWEFTEFKPDSTVPVYYDDGEDD